MTKIKSVEVLMVDLKPKVVRTDAVQSFVSQETPIVKITDEDGVVGTGYSYTIGTGGPAVISLIRKTLAPCIIGEDAEDINKIWRKMLMNTYATSVGAITSLAIAAIDIALWDLRCIRAKLPLWKMAGGAQENIPLYSTEGGWLHIETAELIDDATKMKEQGFKGSKIKIGKPSIDEDRQRLAEVRKAVGEDYLILTDANQAFELPEAKRRADVLAETNVYWFEEPMPADNVTAHQELNKHSRVPIAVGESIYSLSHFQNYLHQNAADIVQADAARIGGITPWLKCAHLAEAYNIPICPHFLMELHVSLVCAVPNAPLLEYIPQLDDITQSKIKIKNGYAVPSDEPGIGIKWDWEKIKPKIVEGSQEVTK